MKNIILTMLTLACITSLNDCSPKKKSAIPLWPLVLLGGANNTTSSSSAGASNTSTSSGGSSATTGNGSSTTGGSGSVTALAADFNISSTFMRVGTVNGVTIPTQLKLTFSNAPTLDTFVTINSSNQASLTVANSGVTMLSGQTNATVNLTGIAQSTSVTLSATVGGTTKTTAVRVVGAGETPQLISLTPTTSSVSIGNSITMTVNLDIPSPPGGTAITLALNPPNNGTVPATVTVPADQISATFSFTAVTGSSVTVDATLGADNKTSNITIH